MITVKNGSNLAIHLPHDLDFEGVSERWRAPGEETVSSSVPPARLGARS